ncbi:MAG: DinB family protein [Phycisphaerales bacterium]|nr:DinB family protein [Phycisphaerales bacterium]
METNPVRIDRLIERMDRFSSVLPALVSGLGPEEALWRPNDTTWSILEIVCHLADEESSDFRPASSAPSPTPNSPGTRSTPRAGPSPAATARPISRTRPPASSPSVTAPSSG